MARDRQTERERERQAETETEKERGAKWQLNVALAHSTI